MVCVFKKSPTSDSLLERRLWEEKVIREASLSEFNATDLCTVSMSDDGEFNIRNSRYTSVGTGVIVIII